HAALPSGPRASERRERPTGVELAVVGVGAHREHALGTHARAAYQNGRRASDVDPLARLAFPLRRGGGGARDLSAAALLEVYRRMRTIRAFEEKLGELVAAGKLAGFLHLYAGEEAVAGGVCSHLGDPDWVGSTHR